VTFAEQQQSGGAMFAEPGIAKPVPLCRMKVVGIALMNSAAVPDTQRRRNYTLTCGDITSGPGHDDKLLILEG